MGDDKVKVDAGTRPTPATVRTGRHLADPERGHTTAPMVYQPQSQSPSPPAVWLKWGWIVVVMASCVAACVALGGLLVWCGVESPWPTRAEAQQTAVVEAQALAKAKADCQAEIQAALGAQTDRLTKLEIATGKLDTRLDGIEKGQNRMADALDRLAQRPISGGRRARLSAPAEPALAAPSGGVP